MKESPKRGAGSPAKRPSSLVSDPGPPRGIASGVRRHERAQARSSPARIPAGLRAFSGSDARRRVLRIPRSPRRTPHPSSLKNARVLVVGDAMLDRYWFGEVERISPEAPVPIVKIDHEEERAGGAANVARNAAALGAQVTLLSVVGADEPGARLEALLKREHIHPQLHHDRNIKTTVKLRVIAGRKQQLLRVDFETSPSHEVLASKLRDFKRILGDMDVVILSDYGKGGLTHIVKMIGLARRAGKKVLVDPKGEDYSRYSGATLITPNRAEFRQVAGGWNGERELTERAQKLRHKLGVQALLVTRGEEGMTLFEDGTRFHVRTQAREVSDVSGAGDTVIAALAVALASGARMKEAVRLANRAAGIVVGKFGTAVVTPEELFGKDEDGRRKAER